MSEIGDMPVEHHGFLGAFRETMRLVEEWAEIQAAEFVTVTWSSGISITYDEGRLTATATEGDYRITAEEIDELLEVRRRPWR